jgi:PKD repeat protein
MNLKKLSIAVLGMTAAIFTSCSKEQAIADFSVSTAYGTAPLEVAFTNLSLYATEYSWDFGTGSTSSSENPTYYFDNPGTYTVTLTASNESNSDKKSVTINVIAKAKPSADFSFSPTTGMAPTEINFTNSTKGATSYSWDFGNGKTSTLQNPSIVYINGGTYTVTLNATGPGGTDKITKTITIKNAPTRLQINSITLLGYPLTRSDGSGWDPSNGPDLYFKLTDNSGTDYLSTGVFYDVIKSNLPLKYSTTFPWIISSLDFDYQIHLMDYDTFGSDELLDYDFFTVRDRMPTDGSDYPTTLLFSNPFWDLEFQMDVAWLP